jgi:hypothetical protein
VVDFGLEKFQRMNQIPKHFEEVCKHHKTCLYSRSVFLSKSCDWSLAAARARKLPLRFSTLISSLQNPKVAVVSEVLAPKNHICQSSVFKASKTPRPDICPALSPSNPFNRHNCQSSVFIPSFYTKTSISSRISL